MTELDAARLTPPETRGASGDDERLLDRLGALVGEFDPVPQWVIAEARAVFRSGGNGSSARRPGGAAIEFRELGLAELLGPASELSPLARRAGADVTAVAARHGGART